MPRSCVCLHAPRWSVCCVLTALRRAHVNAAPVHEAMVDILPKNLVLTSLSQMNRTAASSGHLQDTTKYKPLDRTWGEGKWVTHEYWVKYPLKM